ncbi:MAG: amino acid-binding protein [Frankiales bacterium]|nr:amino acid-binding protein [Frankiales bacterium]
MTYLLRVVMPDRPGMLGAIATALGDAGADIVSLDVVERGPEGAVDDLLVQLPPGGLADVLITSAQKVPGVIVESVRPYLGADDLHRDLELVDELAATPAEGLKVLADLAPGVFRAAWAVVLDGDGVLASSQGAPDLTEVALPWMPLETARRMDPREEWVPERWNALGAELMAAPVGSSGRVILIGRPGGPRFRASEVLRLAHLAGITATVAAVPA